MLRFAIILNKTSNNLSDMSVVNSQIESPQYIMACEI